MNYIETEERGNLKNSFRLLFILLIVGIYTYFDIFTNGNKSCDYTENNIVAVCVDFLLEIAGRWC
jgi:hypothetical protein